MKVILLEDIKGFGKKYDVKEVKDGYARNFLLPRKLAKIAAPRAIKELKFQKAKQEQQEQILKAKLEKLAQDLNGQEFKFNIKIGEKGEAFGSVGKPDIKKALAEKGIEAEVLLERPIKTLGEHRIEINLGKGIKSAIKILIEPE